MFLEIVSPSELVKNFGHAHSAACVAKEPIVIGGKAYIPLNTTAIGVRNAFVYETEVKNAPKAAAQAWAPGAALHWDATAKNFTTTVGTNTPCGFALQAALAADTVSPLFAFNTFV